MGTPYAPDLCRYPPVPNTAYQIPAAYPDSLFLLDISTAGPRYGTLVRWRWTLGDGTVLVRNSPGAVRHCYATVPAYGTPVTLTLTNNLGCSTTQVLYPWGGQPTATQQAQALAARLQLYPNPTTGTAVTLALAGLRAQPAVPLALLDALGRTVRHWARPVQAGRLQQELDLTGLPPGVYTLRLQLAEGPLTKRFVKQ